MNILIVKLGATGDVVRTTTLLHRLIGSITWITAAKNIALLGMAGDNFRPLAWENRNQAADRIYDLVINLEDTLEVGAFLQSIEATRIYGACVTKDGQLGYSEDSRPWFDLSLISRFGRAEADNRKRKNRDTYQTLVFGGLGFRFDGERYLLPEPIQTGLRGDVAISREAGPVWPMKNWAYYDALIEKLKGAGLKVNVLPQRASLLEHLGDVAGHRCLVSGDSLPMHLALGSGVRCVTLFTCTSPWEIHDYGIQTKVVSPLLEEFFYKREFVKRATTAITLEEVFEGVMQQICQTQ